MTNPVTRRVLLSTMVFVAFLALILGVAMRSTYNSSAHTVTRINIVRSKPGMPLGIQRFGVITSDKFRIVDQDTFNTYAVDKSTVHARKITPETENTFAQLDIMFEPPIHRVSQFYLHLEGGRDYSACGTKMFVTYENGVIKEYAIPVVHHGRAWVYRNHRRQPVRPRSPVDTEMNNPHYDIDCSI